VIINHPETRQELSKYFAKCSKEQREVELLESLKNRYHERGFRANRWKCVSQSRDPLLASKPGLIWKISANVAA
jgi:hypothetical protein